MDMSFNCQKAKQINLVDYLAFLGYHPQKVHGPDYWYLSPFRGEKTPSFKVDHRRNLWYDHGDGKGGDLIDFGIRYHRCTVSQLLERLSVYAGIIPAAFGQVRVPLQPRAGEKEESAPGKIVVLDVRPLAFPSLIRYLERRGIPLPVAAKYCQQVDFSLHGKRQMAIGFPNRSGGFELRNEHFKGSSSPKDITFFNTGAGEIAVFEGFFNFLSFQTLNPKILSDFTNFLVLNSLAFFQKSRPLMEQHHRIHLMLDRDHSGRTFTGKALRWAADKFIDRSDYYKEHKDLNEWLVYENAPGSRKSNRGLGRSR